jgi:hypothetical protein
LSSYFHSAGLFLQQGNTLPNNLLGSNLTPLQEFDFSQLIQTHSATKYNPPVATNNLPAISMQEVIQVLVTFLHYFTDFFNIMELMVHMFFLTFISLFYFS